MKQWTVALIFKTGQPSFFVCIYLPCFLLSLSKQGFLCLYLSSLLFDLTVRISLFVFIFPAFYSYCQNAKSGVLITFIFSGCKRSYQQGVFVSAFHRPTGLYTHSSIGFTAPSQRHYRTSFTQPAQQNHRGMAKAQPTFLVGETFRYIKAFQELLVVTCVPQIR